MKINGIDNLDIGMSNIEIEGKVTYEKAPRHVEGDNDRGHYDFYSQFVVIDDDTGKIGCNVSIEKEAYRLEKGVMARVKGKLEQYEDKNGEIQKSLKCSLVGVSKGEKMRDIKQEVAEEYFDEKAKIERLADKVEKSALVEMPTNTPTEKPLNNVWEEKDLRIARECAVKAVTELVCAKIMESKDFFSFSNTIVKYIYNGRVDNGRTDKAKVEPKKPPTTKEEKLALARHIAGGKKLELREGSKGLFPDEPSKEELAEIENAVNEQEEPGSSFNNALPFKGKKRKLKKVSKGKDFIAPEDMPD